MQQQHAKLQPGIDHVRDEDYTTQHSVSWVCRLRVRDSFRLSAGEHVSACRAEAVHTQRVAGCHNTIAVPVCKLRAMLVREAYSVLVWFAEASDLCLNMMKRSTMCTNMKKRPSASSDSAKLSELGNARNPHLTRRDKQCATLATADCHCDCLAGGTLTRVQATTAIY